MGIADNVSKRTSVPIVSSVERALEHACRAVVAAKAVVLTWSVGKDLIGLAGDEEIVNDVVVEGVVAAVAVIRSVKQRKAIVEFGTE